MSSTERIQELLQQASPQPVLPPDLMKEQVAVLDFSAANATLAQVDLSDTDAFSRYVDEAIAAAGAKVGAGGYNEERVIYGSPVFTAAGEARTIHLGIDLWVPAGTPVHAPLAGQVHSFADNAAYRDYGPTIILQHEAGGLRFYTLYGHLSRNSLPGLHKGMPVEAGQQFAFIGARHENVQWPPHLHFQLITDLLGREGDFFGVAPESEREYFLNLCPDPNLLLRIRALS